MNKLTFAMLAVIAAFAAHGQGFVQLNNRVLIDGVDAPITVGCRAPNAANYPTLDFVAQNYRRWNIGIIDVNTGSLIGAPTTFRTDSLSRIGYVNPTEVDIGNQTKYVRVAAWIGPGTTSGYLGAKLSIFGFGESSVFSVTGGVPPSVPTALQGLKSFNLPSDVELDTCPEPSTLAFFALGGVWLAAKRRH